MVLVVLANYAGEDGRSWPSQQLIADEAGCGIRSLKDHLKYLEAAEFITRHTRNLGQGKGSRTSYQIHLRRLAEIRGNAGEDFACADFARANNVSCEGSIPHLTNRHEPSVTIEGKPSIVATSPEQAVQKGSAKVRGSARGSRIAPDWVPSLKDYAFAHQAGLSREEINREADRFRDYWIAASGRNAVKLDWSATWRNWIRSDYRKPKASQHRGGAEQTLSAFDRVAARLAGNADRPAPKARFDGDTIDGEYWPAEEGTGSGA